MKSMNGIVTTYVILFFLLYILPCVVDGFAPFYSGKPSVSPSTVSNRNRRRNVGREDTSVNLIDDSNDGAGNKGSDAKKRIISTDEIGNLFSSGGSNSQIKPSLRSDDDEDGEYDGDEYEYDYDEEDEEPADTKTSSLVKASAPEQAPMSAAPEEESTSLPGDALAMMEGDEPPSPRVGEMDTVELVSDGNGLKFSSSSSSSTSPVSSSSKSTEASSLEEDSDGYGSRADTKYFLDLIDLEKAYAESRTAPEEEGAREMESGDLDIENNIIVDSSKDIEYDWDTGMEYIDMERVLERKQRRSMLDSMSISGPSQSNNIRDIPQYDPTEYEPNNPMLYGAYRRWKLAETEENNKGNGKGVKNGKKKIKSGNKDSFFNSIKNLGKGDKGGGKGQGFGSRAEPPPSMKPVVPGKPVPKKNRKRVITPDSIDSLFSKPEVLDPEVAAAEEDNDDEEENDDEYEDEYEDVDIQKLEVMSATDSSATEMITKSDDNDSITNSRDKPINLKSLVEEEPPQWLVDADKAAKAERRMKKKKKEPLTKDWRFWAAIIGSVGLLSSAFNVYQQTGGSIGPVPSPTELII